MDRYSVTRQIGDGTYGSVWEAVDKETGTKVAVKKMKRRYSTSRAAATGDREARALAAVGPHPAVVTLHGAHVARDALCLVFEKCDCNVYQYIKQGGGGGLPPALAAAWAASLLSALAAVHAAGLVHRDVKPENILVKKPEAGQTGPPVVKLADFGLARPPPRRGARGGDGGDDDAPMTQYVSTRWYRAPEILLRDPDYGFPADVFAVGAVLAELLTGRPLFPGATEADQVALIGAVFGPPSHRATAPPSAAAALAAVRAPPCPRTALEAALARGGGGGVPAGAVDALASLLALDPAARPTAAGALALPFLAKASAAVAADGLLPRPVVHKAAPQAAATAADHLIRARHAPAAADKPAAAVASIAITADTRWAVDDVEAPAVPARVAVAKVPRPPQGHRCPRADADLKAAAAVLEAAVAAAAAEGLTVVDALARRRPSNAV